MKPTATEIDWKSRWICDRPGAPPKPRARFDNETSYTGIAQSPACSESSRAAADNQGLNVIVCHCENLHSAV
jgi:hypothetical protein